MASALLFALSACGGAAETPEEEPSAAASGDSAGEEVDLTAMCQAVGSEEVLPGQDTVSYSSGAGEPVDDPGEQAKCQIEPKDEYDEVATEVELFGRGAVVMAWHTPGQLAELRYPEYEVAAAPDDFATNSWADPLRGEIPCQAEDCEHGITGYSHSYQYEALVAHVSVEVTIDLFTSDLDASEDGVFQAEADEALIAYLDAIAALVEA